MLLVILNLFLLSVSTGIQMLSLLVPVLINFLLEGPALKDASKPCQTLHERSLQWLMKIGPQYPQVCVQFLVS